MGYSTDFTGKFRLNKQLTEELADEIYNFSRERHGGDIEHDPQYPGFWCQWIPTDDRMGIEWDGGEKFYRYGEWLTVIIEKFLHPNGYSISGDVWWEGEGQGPHDDSIDIGTISVSKGKVELIYGEWLNGTEVVRSV